MHRGGIQRPERFHAELLVRNGGGNANRPASASQNPAGMPRGTVTASRCQPRGRRSIWTALSLCRPRSPSGQPAGNRLNINRVGNAAGLVTESRDAGRGNAVIHKSYIKR